MDKYKKSISHPGNYYKIYYHSYFKLFYYYKGETIGAIAAQSVGEPTT